MGTIDNNLPEGIKRHEKKTKYMVNTARMYITGVKINEHNKLTYGHEKTEVLK